jgi:hypothetical protein
MTTATVTKTFTYNAAAVAALMAPLATMTPAERFHARRAIVAKVQRDWVRGGKIGANPAALI